MSCSVPRCPVIGLVQREVDLVSLVDLAVRSIFVIAAAERLEVVDQRLVDEDVAVREEQDALLDAPAFHRRQMIWKAV